MIIIDQQEPEQIEQWFKDQNLIIETKREVLEVGDYLIVYKDFVIPVERKTSDDYVGSLFEHHLNNQLFKLSHNYPESFLLVTYDFYELLMSGRINRHELIASRVSAVTKRSNGGMCGRINIIPLESDYDIPYCLYCIHETMKDEDFTRFLSLQGKKDDDTWLLTMYGGLPGIGAGGTRAQALFKKFPTLESLVSATVEELQSTEGIGKKSAEKIYKKIRGEKL